MEIVQATTATELDQIKVLFREYEQWISEHDPHGINLEYQDFSAEIAGLPGVYAAPKGRLLIGYLNDTPAGCVCLRPAGASSCEMKRLYLRPHFAGQGHGDVLVRTIIDAAKHIGYRFMRLDTLPYMGAAQALYRRHGFYSIPPYFDSPIEGTAYMELDLGNQPSP